MKKDDEQIILAFAMYSRTVDLMKITGLSKPTVVKYKKDVEFMGKANARRKEMLDSAVHRMECEVLKTVDVLCKIRDDRKINAQIRVSACNAILNHFQSYKLSLDVIERIEALEKAEND